MSDDEIHWQRIGKDCGWTMPEFAWWKRLPVIRHVRVIYGVWKVEQWYRTWAAAGIGIRTGYDDWVLHGIWHNYERRW